MNNNKIIPVPKNCINENRKKKLIPELQCETAEWKPLAKVFTDAAKKIFGIVFTEGANGIQIIRDETIGKNAYVVESREKIQILASDEQGCAYALATVLQLMNADGEIEEVRIEDWPEKDYRGLMIDLAREWHPLHILLRYVDLCFFYKIKYLHLHFMDDQRYTLPSRQFPALAKNGEAYSSEEIAQLCSYAKTRGIVLVPEIEMPGHASSLIKAYPEVFANQFVEGANIDRVISPEFTIRGDTILCVGSETTLSAMKTLINEVLELFPDAPYIHLGADEVSTNAWKECSVCKEYMERQGFVDTEELFCDFVGKVTDYVLSKGRRPIVWEGFAKKYSEKIAKDVIVIAWESYYQCADELVESGFDIINCSWQPLYVVQRLGDELNWDVKDILKWNVYEWQHWFEDSAAALNPIHLCPTDQVLGAQICAWSMTYEREIAEIVMRLAALSERTWSVKRYCTDEMFMQKLRIQKLKAFRLISE